MSLRSYHSSTSSVGMQCVPLLLLKVKFSNRNDDSFPRVFAKSRESITESTGISFAKRLVVFSTCKQMACVVVRESRIMWSDAVL